MDATTFSGLADEVFIGFYRLISRKSGTIGTLSASSLLGLTDHDYQPHRTEMDSLYPFEIDTDE